MRGGVTAGKKCKMMVQKKMEKSGKEIFVFFLENFKVLELGGGRGSGMKYTIYLKMCFRFQRFSNMCYHDNIRFG